jgi:hypothetical protein
MFDAADRRAFNRAAALERRIGRRLQSMIGRFGALCQLVTPKCEPTQSASLEARRRKGATMVGPFIPGSST